MKIVTGVLHSPEGEAALERAAEEAVLHAGELLLVSYVSTPQDQQTSRRFEQDRGSVIAAAESTAAPLRERGIEVSVHVPVGVHSPSDAILEVARERAADLIVIGMRHRSRVGKLVLGSNAQDILLNATAPVLAVKPRSDDH